MKYNQKSTSITKLEFINASILFSIIQFSQVSISRLLSHFILCLSAPPYFLPRTALDPPNLREHTGKSRWIALKKFANLSIMQCILSLSLFFFLISAMHSLSSRSNLNNILLTSSLLVESEELMQPSMNFTIAISRRN